MTAYITIPVAATKNALRVPNGALRFKPDLKAEEIRALYQKYGLEYGARTEAAGEQSGAAVGGKQNRARTPGEQVASVQTGAPRLDVAVVWKLHSDNALEPVKIRTGITDHSVTEVAQSLKGELQEGDELVTGSISASKPSSPGMGAPRR